MEYRVLYCAAERVRGSGYWQWRTIVVVVNVVLIVVVVVVVVNVVVVVVGCSVVVVVVVEKEQGKSFYINQPPFRPHECLITLGSIKVL